MEKNLKVLMITGVYIPDFNGAVRQCRQLILELKHLVYFEILCGTNQINEVGSKTIEEIKVTKILIDQFLIYKKIFHFFKFYLVFIRKIQQFDIVHMHGFSLRNAGIILICLLFQKKILLKMTSFGHDDPLSVKRKSPYLYFIYKLCHYYIGISPAFFESFQYSSISKIKFKFIPNGVNLNIFKPVFKEEKIKIREKYGYKENNKIILFIGHFSQEKNPILAYQSWFEYFKSDNNAKLIFIGATTNHFEVDESIVKFINNDLKNQYLYNEVKFIYKTDNIEEYMQIADIFLMTSEREGLPNVLLEAMSCGLPCIVKRLPGITDWIVKDLETGFLFDQNDANYIFEKINKLINDKILREKVIFNALEYVRNNFSSLNTSNDIYMLYKQIARC
jgi:glycosyltransferase involved in cell wall biosynthesis